jgi:hypothetical protein
MPHRVKSVAVVVALIVFAGFAAPGLACWECETTDNVATCETVGQDETGSKFCTSRRTCTNNGCWSSCDASGDLCTTNPNCQVVGDVVICEEHRDAQIDTRNGQPLEGFAPRGLEPVACKA